MLQQERIGCSRGRSNVHRESLFLARVVLFRGQLVTRGSLAFVQTVMAEDDK